MKKLVTGIVLLVLTLPLLAVYLYRGIRDLPEAERQPVPGAFTVQVPETDDYYLWHHHETTFRGRRYDLPADLPHGAFIRIESHAGKAVNWQTNDGISVSSPGEKRRSVGEVRLTPGTYTVRVSGFDEPRVMSLGPGVLGDILRLVFGGLFILLFGTGGGILLVVIGLAQRAAARRREAHG